MNSSATQVDIAIVGGGITGLSAAWYIEQHARQRGQTLRYVVLEKSAHWGGKIRTVTWPETETGGAFVVEGGPDAFITQKPWALELARELGLTERLLPTNEAQRQVFVLHKGRPIPLPDGVMLIVPTKLTPFILSPLLSPWGKLRMGLDLVIPARRDGGDETLADFIRRRLGNEALEKIAEPLMAGIYNAEAEKQSLLATFPRFRALEEKYGSLIRGMLASKKRASQTVAPPSVFMSLRGGMTELVQALCAQLTGDCRLRAGVHTIRRNEAGGYSLALENGERISAESIILTTPAYITARLIQPLAPDAADHLNHIRYVSTGTISLAFRRHEIAHPLNGFGLVIPRREQRPINAITWTSTKFAHRAPEGYVLLRAFFGGSRTPQTMALGDAELLAVVRRELQALLHIDAQPIAHQIFRWQQANPQYDIDHLTRVNAVEAALPAGLWVTGSALRGVGIPDCIYQARQTADAVIAHLDLKATQFPSPHYG